MFKMQSELRRDIVSGDWILLAPGRGKRPDAFVRNGQRKRIPLKQCPFESYTKPDFGGQEIISAYPMNDRWKVLVVPNKYPAVHSEHDISKEEIAKASQNNPAGPYLVKTGFGHHDLIITRDHDKFFTDLDKNEATVLIGVFRDRYLRFLKHKNIAYVGMFHNFGEKAGATVYHPHYQILAVSVVPPDVQHSLRGSTKYNLEHKKCVHCVLIDWEMRQKKRIIFENKWAVAFAPYFSRVPFEVKVFPKKHLPYFEDTPTADLIGITEALRQSLKKIKNSLDPDYNFFIHTSPIQDKKSYSHYHWHIEILPKISSWGGFELQTGIEINVIDPDDAARFIR